MSHWFNTVELARRSDSVETAKTKQASEESASRENPRGRMATLSQRKSVCSIEEITPAYLLTLGVGSKDTHNHSFFSNDSFHRYERLKKIGSFVYRRQTILSKNYKNS